MVIEIRIQEWSEKPADEIVRDTGFLIDEADWLETVELIRQALKESKSSFFGVN